MSQSLIKHLNRILGERLGYVASDRGELPRYCWMRTTEVFYFYEGGVREVTPPGCIVSLVMPEYVRHSEAERYGDVWCIAAWKPPRIWSESLQQYVEIQKERWNLKDMPFPEKGMYYVVDGTVLSPGAIPTEKDTLEIIHTLQCQMEASQSELLEKAKAEGKQPQDEKRREFADKVDDWWPAFDNENARPDRLGQSRGGHVSFGGI